MNHTYIYLRPGDILGPNHYMIRAVIAYSETQSIFANRAVAAYIGFKWHCHWLLAERLKTWVIIAIWGIGFILRASTGWINPYLASHGDICAGDIICRPRPLSTLAQIKLWSITQPVLPWTDVDDIMWDPVVLIRGQFHRKHSRHPPMKRVWYLHIHNNI